MLSSIHVASKGDDPVAVDGPRSRRLRKCVLAWDFKLSFVLDITLATVIPEVNTEGRKD
jgi:hypothetical protein